MRMDIFKTTKFFTYVYLLYLSFASLVLFDVKNKNKNLLKSSKLKGPYSI